jgi:hypothetical protein
LEIVPAEVTVAAMKVKMVKEVSVFHDGKMMQ